MDKKDLAQDKALIKKAIKQHDMQEHKGGKGTKLALRKGGVTGMAMRKVGRLTAQMLDDITPHVVPGVTTDELDKIIYDMHVKTGSVPGPLNYRGYPKSVCTSVNHVVCHGIPGDRTLKDGDINPACAQSCPSKAIVFGDVNDRESAVSKLMRAPRGVRLLEDLGTRPNVTYLPRQTEA